MRGKCLSLAACAYGCISNSSIPYIYVYIELLTSNSAALVMGCAATCTDFTTLVRLQSSTFSFQCCNNCRHVTRALSHRRASFPEIPTVWNFEKTVSGLEWFVPQDGTGVPKGLIKVKVAKISNERIRTFFFRKNLVEILPNKYISECMFDFYTPLPTTDTASPE